MEVTVFDLDGTVKEKLREEIRVELFKEYKSLPLLTEESKISAVITDSVKEKLDGIVKEYYEFFKEHDITTNISVSNYIDVYLNRI